MVSGKLGLAFHFNGTSDYVNCGDLPVWNQTTGIRLEAWVNPDPGTGAITGPIISKEAIVGGLKGYFIGADYNGDGTANFEGGFAVPTAIGGSYGDGAVVLKSTQTYSCGQWHSVAAEFDGFEARLFVDGALADANYRDGTDGFYGAVRSAGPAPTGPRPP